MGIFIYILHRTMQGIVPTCSLRLIIWFQINGQCYLNGSLLGRAVSRTLDGYLVSTRSCDMPYLPRAKAAGLQAARSLCTLL